MVNKITAKPQNQISLYPTILSFALAGLCVYLSLTPHMDAARYIGWVGYIAILLAFGLLLSGGKMYLQKRMPLANVWLHPPILITAWVLVGFGLPGLYAFVDDEILGTFSVLFHGTSIHFIIGPFMFLYGSIFMWLGYGIGLSWIKAPSWAYRLARCEVHWLPVILLFTIALLAQLVRIVTSGIAFGADNSVFGPFSQWLAYLENISRLMLAIFAIKAFRREWSTGPLVVFLCIQILLAFMSGFMKPLLWIGATTLLAAQVAQKTNWRQISKWAIIFTFLGILIVPVAQDIRRQSGGFNAQNLADVAQATLNALNNSWGQGISVGLEEFSDKMFGRQTGVIHIPAQIVNLTPAIIPYQGIENFLLIPTYLIPRALWPSKPILSKGVWFNVTYFNATTDTVSSTGMTIYGEGYLFAGWIGVGIVGLSFGLLLALVYRFTVPVGLVPVLIALLPSFLDVEPEYSAMFIGILQQTIVFFGFYWIINFLNLERVSRTLVVTTFKRPSAVQ